MEITDEKAQELEKAGFAKATDLEGVYKAVYDCLSNNFDGIVRGEFSTDDVVDFIATQFNGTGDPDSIRAFINERKQMLRELRYGNVESYKIED